MLVFVIESITQQSQQAHVNGHCLSPG